MENWIATIVTIAGCIGIGIAAIWGKPTRIKVGQLIVKIGRKIRGKIDGD